MIFKTQDWIAPPETQYISRKEHLRAESWATPVFGGWNMRKKQHQEWIRSLNQENVGPGSQRECLKGGSDQQYQLADQWQVKKNENDELIIRSDNRKVTVIVTEWHNVRDDKEILNAVV